MDKRVIICIIIIITLGVLAFLFVYYFEIKEVKTHVLPIREYYSNNYLVLERWLTKAGIDVTYLNDYEADYEMGFIDPTEPKKTYLITNPAYLLMDNSWEELTQWINSGKNLIICLNQSDTNNILLSDLGITTGTTPDYHAYSDEHTPDYHWKIKFDVEDGKDYFYYYDIHDNIRIIKIPLEQGSFTIIGLPIFMWNTKIEKESNARLAWELLAPYENEVVIVRNYREPYIKKSLFGTLMQRGNLFPMLVSSILLIIFGFWSVIPLFGLLKSERTRNSRPIKERFAAEISFLKKYKGLYYYDDAINKLRGEE